MWLLLKTTPMKSDKSQSDCADFTNKDWPDIKAKKLSSYRMAEYTCNGSSWSGLVWSGLSNPAGVMIKSDPFEQISTSKKELIQAEISWYAR